MSVGDALPSVGQAGDWFGSSVGSLGSDVLIGAKRDDRIDTTCGYEESNVQWVGASVNRMRGDLPLDQFIELCHEIADNNPTNSSPHAPVCSISRRAPLGGAGPVWQGACGLHPALVAPCTRRAWVYD